ncbi:hypothetical protein TRIP_C21054 [Candidatus Zixiibacteriota bacterium]|nr:hypothetical protein TRIP_C21054 [candidate division Zixibacteria bacterium]
MKILMIGNDLGAFETLSRQIVSAGHEAVKIPSCTSGVRKLKSEQSFDAVIVDADLPGKEVLRFLRAVRNDQSLADFPVITAGEAHSEQNVVAYHDLRVNDILVYPVSPATLEAKLARIKGEGKRTVLIVDDEPYVAETIAEMLGAQRYRTIIARSGEEALHILQEMAVHALVTDIMMPHVTGIDLLKVVKANYPHIPVIMITAHFGKYRPRDAINLGADGFFAKPFHDTELIYTLQSLLEQYRPLQFNLSHQDPEK